MSNEKYQEQNDTSAEADEMAGEMADTTVLPDDYKVRADDPAEQAGGETLEEALAKAEETAEENWNKYLRVVAELDNVRKRAARDVEKARMFGVEKLASELLEVADSLEMALETGSQAPAENLLEGGRATLKQLYSAMDRSGIAVVNPEGENFDPEFHEAISVQESPTAEPNSVLLVVQRGYTLNGRLLRPARVIVAKDPAS